MNKLTPRNFLCNLLVLFLLVLKPSPLLAVPHHRDSKCNYPTKSSAATSVKEACIVISC